MNRPPHPDCDGKCQFKDLLNRVSDAAPPAVPGLVWVVCVSIWKQLVALSIYSRRRDRALEYALIGLQQVWQLSSNKTVLDCINRNG